MIQAAEVKLRVYGFGLGVWGVGLRVQNLYLDPPMYYLFRYS